MILLLKNFAIFFLLFPSWSCFCLSVLLLNTAVLFKLSRFFKPSVVPLCICFTPAHTSSSTHPGFAENSWEGYRSSGQSAKLKLWSPRNSDCPSLLSRFISFLRSDPKIYFGLTVCIFNFRLQKKNAFYSKSILNTYIYIRRKKYIYKLYTHDHPGSTLSTLFHLYSSWIILKQISDILSLHLWLLQYVKKGNFI